MGHILSSQSLRQSITFWVVAPVSMNYPCMMDSFGYRLVHVVWFFLLLATDFISDLNKLLVSYNEDKKIEKYTLYTAITSQSFLLSSYTPISSIRGEFTSACGILVYACDELTNSAALMIGKTQFGQPDAVHKSSVWHRGAAAGTAVIEKSMWLVPSMLRRMEADWRFNICSWRQSVIGIDLHPRNVCCDLRKKCAGHFHQRHRHHYLFSVAF